MITYLAIFHKSNGAIFLLIRKSDKDVETMSQILCCYTTVILNKCRLLLSNVRISKSFWRIPTSRKIQISKGFFSNSFFIQVFDRVEIWERHIVFKKTYETHTYHLQNWLVLNIISFFALIQNMCVTDIYKKSHFYYK